MFAQVDKLREIDVANENMLAHSENELTMVSTFKESQAYVSLMNFILDLNEAVKGAPVSSVTGMLKQSPHPGVSAAMHLLESIEQLIEKVPPHNQQSRFGNKAFRDFIQLLSSSEEDLTRGLYELAPSPVTQEQRQELSRYFLSSFGDAQRIDYGTGHEMNFVCWLFGLSHIGVLAPNESHDLGALRRSLVLAVFTRYLALIRRLQSTYFLEPAGSRGVWGLDDYHFLPFLWGASQLVAHPRIKPKSVRYPEILEGFGSEFLYLSSLQFIHQVKVCSFAEHSPLLNDITAVKSWEKVNEGLVKMYNKDVLGRFAVVQHFIYTSLLPKSKATSELRSFPGLDPHDHTHSHSAFHSHSHEEEKGAHQDGATAVKELPCCSDIIHFPSAVGSKAVEAPIRDPLASLKRHL